MRRPFALLLVAGLFVSCSGDETSTDSSVMLSTETSSELTTTPSTAPPTAESTIAETSPPISDVPIATLPADQVAQLVASRPYNTFVPSWYDPATEMPLVLMLHGFRSDATYAEDYIQFQPLAEERGFIYVRPEGSPNEDGDRFWNATDACCGGNSTVDDATYLRAVIDDLKANFAVDESRVYIVGHSNGGFMAYRMACEHADAIAAIVSLAGATDLNVDNCAPTEPVSVLQVHGTADRVIYFDGGTFMQPSPYPGAMRTVETWSTYNQCATAGELTRFDLDPNIAGDEATIVPFESCASATTVELWIMDGVGHNPVPTAAMSALVDFLFAHAKA